MMRYFDSVLAEKSFFLSTVYLMLVASLFTAKSLVEMIHESL